MIDTPRDLVPEAPYDLVEKMRASIVVLGPLLARAGAPGCRCRAATTSGPARSTTTSTRFPKMGAEFTTSHGYVEGTVPGGQAHGRRDRASSTRATPRPTTC